jgi:ATP-dependent DNA ligase
MAFDVLALADDDLRHRPFSDRRAALEELLSDAPPAVQLTPATNDADIAREWMRGFVHRGVDGIVAKHSDLHYEPGRRAMLKIKPERTADCVVAGYRWYADDPHQVGSLLLGLYDERGTLVHVGVVTSFPRVQRRALARDLARDEVSIEGHPWEHGFGLGRSPMGRLKGAAGRWDPSIGPRDWTPLMPTLVAEVAYDSFEQQRFRHPARFRRWRPDRDARSCTFAQLEEAA